MSDIPRAAAGGQQPQRGRRVSIQTGFPQPELLDLPWQTPLAEWPDEVLVAYPRGISRHVVRFARVGRRVLAAKETTARNASREYDVLRRLRQMGTPSVVPVAVVTGRRAPDGGELPAVLLTEHLAFSLPYRVLFSDNPDAEIADKLVDALALLLVQLHLAGFYWGDVSLSNTLFLRDAGAFAACLVDAETGELHPRLTDGQRRYDLDLASTNVAGELMDLLAAFEQRQHPADIHDDLREAPAPEDRGTHSGPGYEPAAATSSLPALPPEQTASTPVDPFTTAQRLTETYDSLWRELTDEESFPHEQKWRVAERVERLHELGFDVEEASLDTDDDGVVRLIPRVVEPGHHSRRVRALTGLSARENQARRILTDIRQFGRALYPGLPEDMIAGLWKQEVFTPMMRAIPAELRAKREPAEIVHEVLEHRWFLSERQRADVPTEDATRDYLESQLRRRPDEEMLL
ncbi:DUF4032 domain-containing protein [Kocuria palustris]|uniref:DUF4032 domain-containing protein n=1 Tax=Kocuria palustris TaxID=71999 RepID=UPI0011A3496B|nr:DUF4032 domain-containing protein [Kocuria palustris]